MSGSAEPRPFTGVSVDLEARAAYVRYAGGDAGGRSERWSDDVVVDVAASGEVAGIELLALHDDALDQGRACARERALRFPRDLGAIIAPA